MMESIGSTPLVVGVVVAVVVVLILAAVSRWRARACPQCGTKLPTFRRPTSTRQLLWGGWTCARCGAEIDRRGTAMPGTGAN